MPSMGYMFSEGICEYANKERRKSLKLLKKNLKYFCADVFKYLQIMLILFMAIRIYISHKLFPHRGFEAGTLKYISLN